MHAEMVLEVLQMMYGISAAFECNLRLFARILGAEVPKWAGFDRESRGVSHLRVIRRDFGA